MPGSGLWSVMAEPTLKRSLVMCGRRLSALFSKRSHHPSRTGMGYGRCAGGLVFLVDLNLLLLLHDLRSSNHIGPVCCLMFVLLRPAAKSVPCRSEWPVP